MGKIIRCSGQHVARELWVERDWSKGCVKKMFLISYAYVHKYTHSSLFSPWLDSQTTKKSVNLRKTDSPRQNILGFFCFCFFCRNICDGNRCLCHWTPWTLHSMTRWPVQTVEWFWCHYPLKGLSDVLLFFWQPREERGIIEVTEPFSQRLVQASTKLFCLFHTQFRVPTQTRSR